MSSIQQRLEKAEERVHMNGDAHELGQCCAARKALQAGDLERVQYILKALEAPTLDTESASGFLEEEEPEKQRPLSIYGGVY